MITSSTKTLLKPVSEFNSATAFLGAVAGIIHDVHDTVVLPALTARKADITKKQDTAAGGDFVLSIDLAGEAYLRETLCALVPGSYAVGEESFASADPHQMDRIRDGVSWIIDPLDGTNNVKRYITGESDAFPHYGTMVVMTLNGQAEAAWIFTNGPAESNLLCGIRGRGCYAQNENDDLVRLNLVEPERYQQPLVVTLPITYPAPFREIVEERNMRGEFALHAHHPRSAAHETTMLLRGEVDAAAFRQFRLWDHLAGDLLVTEAGGYSALFSGREPTLGDHMHDGALFATSPLVWGAARQALLGAQPYTHTAPL